MHLYSQIFPQFAHCSFKEYQFEICLYVDNNGLPYYRDRWLHRDTIQEDSAYPIDHLTMDALYVEDNLH